MVSVTSFNGKSITGLLEISGLSTDEKPIDTIDGYRIMNGSSFFEIDTGFISFYSESDKTWYSM